MSDTLKQDPIAVFIGDDLHSFLYRRHTPASMTQVFNVEAGLRETGLAADRC